MKAGQLISMLKGLEDFELKDCGLTYEILNDLNPSVDCDKCISSGCSMCIYWDKLGDCYKEEEIKG